MISPFDILIWYLDFISWFHNLIWYPMLFFRQLVLINYHYSRYSIPGDSYLHITDSGNQTQEKIRYLFCPIHLVPMRVYSRTVIESLRLTLIIQQAGHYLLMNFYQAFLLWIIHIILSQMPTSLQRFHISQLTQVPGWNFMGDAKSAKWMSFDHEIMMKRFRT